MPTAKCNQAQIYYETSGEGPAVIFAHGRGGNAASWWQQVPHFRERYRVIVYDHRTFGRSAGGGEHFNQVQLADDLIAVLDAAGVERAAVVAQSMGGWSGLGAAALYPDRVSCLVLTSTVAGIWSDAVLAALAETKTQTPSLGLLPLLALAPDFPRQNPPLAQLYLEISGFNTGVAEEVMAHLRDPGRTLPPERLEGYRVPTLFISAENDQIFPPPVLRAAAQSVPGAELEPFPVTGHSPYWEDAVNYNKMVGAFLEKHLPW